MNGSTQTVLGQILDKSFFCVGMNLATYAWNIGLSHKYEFTPHLVPQLLPSLYIWHIYCFINLTNYQNLCGKAAWRTGQHEANVFTLLWRADHYQAERNHAEFFFFSFNEKRKRHRFHIFLISILNKKTNDREIPWLYVWHSFATNKSTAASLSSHLVVHTHTTPSSNSLLPKTDFS